MVNREAQAVADELNSAGIPATIRDTDQDEPGKVSLPDVDGLFLKVYHRDEIELMFNVLSGDAAGLEMRLGAFKLDQARSLIDKAQKKIQKVLV